MTKENQLRMITYLKLSEKQSTPVAAARHVSIRLNAENITMTQMSFNTLREKAR